MSESGEVVRHLADGKPYLARDSRKGERRMGGTDRRGAPSAAPEERETGDIDELIAALDNWRRDLSHSPHHRGLASLIGSAITALHARSDAQAEPETEWMPCCSAPVMGGGAVLHFEGCPAAQAEPAGFVVVEHEGAFLRLITMDPNIYSTAEGAQRSADLWNRHVANDGTYTYTVCALVRAPTGREP